MTRNGWLTVCFRLVWCAALVVPASAQHFKQVTGTLTQVAAGRNEVFGIGTSNQVYRFNPGTKTFGLVSGGLSLTQVAVGGGALLQKDEVWGVGTSGQIYHFNFGTKTFTQVGGSLAQIAVAEGDQDNCHPYEVWGINSALQVYRFNYCSSAWVQIQVPNPFTRIATGESYVWGLDEFAQIWEYDFRLSQWFQIAGSLQQITVGVNDVWGADGNGFIYRYDFDSRQFVNYNPPFASQLAAGGEGVWVVDIFGQIWRHDPSDPTSTGFVQIPGALTQIAVGSGAGVWGVNSSHQVFALVRP